MSDAIIRPAYSMWTEYNEALRDHVAELTDDQLAIQPSAERWPIWATVGHLACQRVFWLCDFAGEPGKEATPFTNAAFTCPGDDDLQRSSNDAWIGGPSTCWRRRSVARSGTRGGSIRVGP